MFLESQAQSLLKRDADLKAELLSLHSKQDRRRGSESEDDKLRAPSRRHNKDRHHQDSKDKDRLNRRHSRIESDEDEDGCRTGGRRGRDEQDERDRERGRAERDRERGRDEKGRACGRYEEDRDRDQSRVERGRERGRYEEDRGGERGRDERGRDERGRDERGRDERDYAEDRTNRRHDDRGRYDFDNRRHSYRDGDLGDLHPRRENSGRDVIFIMPPQIFPTPQPSAQQQQHFTMPQQQQQQHRTFRVGGGTIVNDY